MNYSLPLHRKTGRFLLLLCLLALVITSNAQKTPGRTGFEGPPPPPPRKGEKPMNVTSPTDLSYLVPKLKLSPEVRNTGTYNPIHFYLERVEDSSYQDSVGFAILPKDYRRQKIVFAGNMEDAFNKYMNSILKKDSSRIPVILRIRKYHIEESKINNADLTASIELRFDILCRANGKDLIFLDDIGGKRKSEIYVGFKREYDTLLKQDLRELPELIDTMISVAREVAPAFIKTIKVTAGIKESNRDYESGDTILIDNRNYLQWTDFRAEPLDNAAISLFTGILIDKNFDKLDNTWTIQLNILPIVLRDKSWAGEKVKTGRYLNHAHYETLLVYRYALELKKRLNNQEVPAEDPLEIINKILNEVNDRLNTEKQKYYYNTKGGENSKAQAEWEDKIDKELKEFMKE